MQAYGGLRESLSSPALEKYKKQRGIGTQPDLGTIGAGGQMVPLIPGNATLDAKHRYLNQFEAFKTETLPGLRMKTIVNI